MIEKIYRVSCSGCYRLNDIHHESNINRAKAAFRSIGWGTQKGKWYCPSCIQVSNTVTEVLSKSEK